MRKDLNQEFLAKLKAVVHGPDADLLIEFVDLLYHRQEEYDSEPLTETDWAAIREGKEAIKRGEFITLEELERELGL